MTSWLLLGSLTLLYQTRAPGKCVLLSTSWVVRGFMKDWVLSGSGDWWFVNLDVGDLGRHLGTTDRRRAATLDGRVGLLLARILVVMALPLYFAVKLGSCALSSCLVLFMALMLQFFLLARCIGSGLPFSGLV